MCNAARGATENNVARPKVPFGRGFFIFFKFFFYLLG